MTQTDVSTESQNLISKAEALIKEAEKSSGELEALYARYGLTREDLEKIIEAGMAALTPEQKAQIEQDEIEWQRGIEEIMQTSGVPARPKDRPGMVRI